ncbi:hypothetical protein ACVIGA_003116 [Bradyrhizobium sp. USDA 3240]
MIGVSINLGVSNRPASAVVPKGALVIPTVIEAPKIVGALVEEPGSPTQATALRVARAIDLTAFRGHRTRSRTLAIGNAG